MTALAATCSRSDALRTEPLRATYLVVGTGEATITSYTDIACNHDPTPCPSPSVRWTLRLTVS